MARPADTLPCTLCAWYQDDVPALWRAWSPTKSWHYLCEAHYTLYAGKYSQHHILTPALVHKLTVHGDPFHRRYDQ